MIETTHQCRQCGSTDLAKNGHNASGSRQYHGKACGAYLVLDPKSRSYPEEEKERTSSRLPRTRFDAGDRAHLRGQPQHPLAVARKKGREQPDLSDTA